MVDDWLWQQQPVLVIRVNLRSLMDCMLLTTGKNLDIALLMPWAFARHAKVKH